MRVIAWFAFVVMSLLCGCDFASEDGCASGEPQCERPIDPRCAGEGAGYCNGDERVQCSLDGFSYDHHDCAGESKPRTCVEGAFGIPFCAVSGGQNERCQGEPWPALCDAGILTLCREGFVEEVRACPGGACIEHDWHRNFCALSTERDPRCMNEGPALDRRFCDHSWIIDCIDGYASLFIDCGKQQCGESPDGQYASCY